MIVYDTGHINSRNVCGAFYMGVPGAKIVTRATRVDGSRAFFYGALRGNRALIKMCEQGGVPWYFGDNGYFKPGHWDGYFRVTKNALQHDGSGSHGPDRWEKLGIKLAPWRSSGSHIVVCPPTRLHGVMWGYNADRWLMDTLAALARVTDRPIRVRDKMSWQKFKARGTGTPLADDLKDAWALVTRISNAAVEAVVAGVPVICTAPCAARAMGAASVDQVEAPPTPDREQWAWNLAANQWTLAEFRDGTCWRHLCAG